MNEAMVDRVAAAIMDSATAPHFRAVWADQPEEVKTHWRFAARAAINAMDQWRFEAAGISCANTQG